MHFLSFSLTVNFYQTTVARWRLVKEFRDVSHLRFLEFQDAPLRVSGWVQLATGRQNGAIKGQQNATRRGD